MQLDQCHVSLHITLPEIRLTGTTVRINEIRDLCNLIVRKFTLTFLSSVQSPLPSKLTMFFILASFSRNVRAITHKLFSFKHFLLLCVRIIISNVPMWWAQLWTSYERAPWFHANAFEHRPIQVYAGDEGFHSGEVQLSSLSSFKWECFFLLDTHCLWVHPTSPLLYATGCPKFPHCCWDVGAWFWLLGYKLSILGDNPSAPCPVCIDLWGNQTVLEASLKGALRKLVDCGGEWHGIVDVHSDTILWAELRFPLQYNTWEKFEDTCRADFVRLERRVCLRLGIFEQGHQLEVDTIFENRQSFRFVPIPEWWPYWKVAQDCRCELGAPLLQSPHYATAEWSLDEFPGTISAGKPVAFHLELPSHIPILVINYRVDGRFLLVGTLFAPSAVTSSSVRSVWLSFSHSGAPSSLSPPQLLGPPLLCPETLALAFCPSVQRLSYPFSTLPGTGLR